MGDHRATVKIDFTIHGKTYKMDSWINWFDDGNGVDSRVSDFFRESWKDALARYDREVEALYQRDRARDIENSERMELERLRAKYDSKETT